MYVCICFQYLFCLHCCMHVRPESLSRDTWKGWCDFTNSVSAVYSCVWWQIYVSDIDIIERSRSTRMDSLVIQRQLRWSDHVVRMEDDRILKNLLYDELAEGKRPAHKPKLMYKDCITEWQHHSKWLGKNPTLDHSSWRKAVNNGKNSKWMFVGILISYRYWYFHWHRTWYYMLWMWLRLNMTGLKIIKDAIHWKLENLNVTPTARGSKPCQIRAA